MDFIRSFKFSILLLATLSITACSNSNETDSNETDSDTRSTINSFLNNKPAVSKSTFTEDMKDSANKASISFAKHVLDNTYQNSVIVTWPMLSHLPFITSAVYGDTNEEVMLGLNDFGLEVSWSHAIEAIRANTSANIEIDHRIWWQEDSRYESSFLSQIDASLNPLHINKNFQTDYDVLEDVNDVVTNFFKDSYSFYLQDYFNTRMIFLNQVKVNSSFDIEDIEFEAFDGLFLENETLIRAPMLRFQGMIDTYEDSDLLAHKISFGNDLLSLISVQPKTGMRSYVLENLRTIFNKVNSSWVQQEARLVLPVTTIDFQIEEENWLKWKDIGLIYSEVYADLRAMDHLGGLYMQSMPYKNHINISTEGVRFSGVAGHAVIYSDLNITGDQNSHNGVFTNLPTPPYIPECSEVTEDLLPGFIIVMDESNGIIQSILSFMSLEGEKECSLSEWGA